MPNIATRVRALPRSPRALAPDPIRALAAAPERLTLILVGLAVASGITVSLGAFRPYTTLPLAAALIAVGWVAIPAGPRDRRSALGGAIALGGSILWVLANLNWVAQYFIVRRDPGFLTLSALWLTHHPSTDIPSGGTVETAHSLGNVLADAPQAWNLNGDMIQPQGAKLLPALAAVGGWAGGTTGVLVANLVVGAIGLLATYAVARLLMGPIASLVPAFALSLTVSHIWLSRADYTEPITMVLLLAAIAWAWKGVEGGKVGALVAAGVASGATLLARIDGPVFALGIAVGVAVALALSRRGSLRARAGWFVTFAMVQAGMTLVGHASIWRWSRGYVARLGSESHQLDLGYTAAIAALIVTAIAIPFIQESRRQRSGRGALASRLVAYLPHVLAGGMALMFLVLISRPFWMTTHTSDPNDFQIGVVSAWQRNEGLPVDGTRTYGESTLTGVSYYLTWPVILLGVAGFAIAAWHLGKARATWAVPLAGFLVPSLLYVIRPAIMPDQVWAIRRLAPSLVVGLLIMAAVAWQALIVRWARSRGDEPAVRSGASIAIAGLIVAGPLLSWIVVTHADGWRIGLTNAIYVAEQRNAREQVDELCSYIDGRPVILVGTSSHFGTIRVACDVPVFLALTSTTPSNIAAMAEAYGEQTVVLTRTVEDVPWVVTPPEPTFLSTVYFSTSSLRGLPVGIAGEQHFDWYVGLAEPDGTVEFVPGDATP